MNNYWRRLIMLRISNQTHHTKARDPGLYVPIYERVVPQMLTFDLSMTLSLNTWINEIWLMDTIRYNCIINVYETMFYCFLFLGSPIIPPILSIDESTLNSLLVSWIQTEVSYKVDILGLSFSKTYLHCLKLLKYFYSIF